MRKHFTVIWSQIAERDFLAIIEYIANDSPSRAYEIFKEVKRRASGLRSFPERGRVVPELQEQGITQYHELIIGPWRLIYRISEKQVYVLSMFDSRRSVEDILLRRFVNMEL